MPTVYKLPGGAIQANTITTSQLQTTVVTQIQAGGGPKVKSLIYPSNDTAANTTGGQTVYLTGSGFAANAQVLVNGSAVPSQSFISASNISFTTPALSTGTYPVYLINPEDGGTAILYPGLLISGEPTWVTSAGSLSGSQDEGSAWSFSLSTTGDTPITYALAAGNTLPSGITLAANGLISGTISSPTGNVTTYTFSVVATDAQNQDSTRQFSVTTSTGEGVLFANNVLLIHADGTNNQNNHTFLDSSNNNFTITRNGNATQGSFSPFSQTGWSNYFDGSGDYLSVSANAGFDIVTGNFTVESWIYDQGPGAERYIFSNRPVNAGWEFRKNATNLLQFFFTTGSSITSTSTITPNVWTHVAVTRESSTVRIFINGNLDASASFSDGVSGVSSALYLGYGTTGGGYFLGYMSNARIVKGTALYTSNFTPSTTPLTAVANTQLLTCQSNRFYAKSAEYAIINAKIYSTYNGGTRSNNYTVQYSDDNVAWTNAFSGVMQSNNCGIFTGTGGGGNYGSHKYWRYVTGNAVTQHHPRVSRIILSSATQDYDVSVFTSDNCTDSGTIPAEGATYTLSADLALTRNGDVSVQAFSPFAPTAAYSTANVGGSAYFDGTGDYLTLPSSSNLAFGTGDFCIEMWVYFTGSPAGDQLLTNISGSETEFSFRIDASNYPKVQSWFTNYAISNTAVGPNQWYHLVACRASNTLSIFVNGARTASGTVTNNFSSTNAMTIGGASGTEFSGYISSMRITKGSSPYDPTQTTITVPTTPPTNITNTQLLCNFTNAGVFDQTAKNIIETVGDAKISTAQYKYGTASMYFDGSGDWLLMRPNSLLNFGTGDFTVEGWFYITSSISTYRMIIANAPNSPDCYVCLRSGDVLEVVAAGALVAQYNLGGSVALNTWFHMALTRSGTTLRAFINGTSLGSVTSSSSFDFSASSGTYIGRWGGGTAYEWVGYMDDLRLTRGYARYTANFTPPSSALKDK